MKKQILALSVCLALSATTMLTCDAAKVAQKNVKKNVTCATKVQKKVVTPAKTELLTPEQQAKKDFLAKIAQERENLYCKLGLTAEQKTKAIEINKKLDESAEPLLKNLKAEKCKLMELKAKNATENEICKQKNEVKKIKKELKENLTAAKKDFEAILTKDQLVILEQIKKEHQKQRCMMNAQKKHAMKGHKDQCKMNKPVHKNCGCGCGCGCEKTQVKTECNSVAPQQNAVKSVK